MTFRVQTNNKASLHMQQLVLEFLEAPQKGFTWFKVKELRLLNKCTPFLYLVWKGPPMSCQ